MGAVGALAELGNQQVPRKHPREFTDAQRPEISLQDEFFYGCCRGTCGTGIGGTCHGRQQNNKNRIFGSDAEILY